VLTSIPPKYLVARVIGYIKGKSANQIARRFLNKPRGFVGESFWRRGYFALSVRRDELANREHIGHQAAEVRRLDQRRMGL
jgi:putative transposase